MFFNFQNNVGLMAINDANLMNEEIYHLLKIYFSDKSYYVKLVEIFHEVIQ
jgi:farnesyl diphosphate synthase